MEVRAIMTTIISLTELNRQLQEQLIELEHRFDHGGLSAPNKEALGHSIERIRAEMRRNRAELLRQENL